MDDIIKDFQKLINQVEDESKKHPEDNFLKDILDCTKDK